jgi:hypothetical protein
MVTGMMDDRSSRPKTDSRVPLGRHGKFEPGGLENRETLHCYHLALA